MREAEYDHKDIQPTFDHDATHDNFGDAQLPADDPPSPAHDLDLLNSFQQAVKDHAARGQTEIDQDALLSTVDVLLPIVLLNLAENASDNLAVLIQPEIDPERFKTALNNLNNFIERRKQTDLSKAPQHHLRLNPNKYHPAKLKPPLNELVPSFSQRYGLHQ